MLARTPAIVIPLYGLTALKRNGDGAGTASRAKVGPRQFLFEERGATSAEYALIIVMLGMGVVVAAWGLAGAIAGGLSWTGAQIAAVTQTGETADGPVRPGKAPPAVAAAKGQPDDPSGQAKSPQK